jgi:phytoene dehydrogenase-like protein
LTTASRKPTVTLVHGASLGFERHSAGASIVRLPVESRVPGAHRTAVPGLWLIGAATWPGPGVTGTSGRAVARELIGTTAHATLTH